MRAHTTAKRGGPITIEDRNAVSAQIGQTPMTARPNAHGDGFILADALARRRDQRPTGPLRHRPVVPGSVISVR